MLASSRVALRLPAERIGVAAFALDFSVARLVLPQGRSAPKEQADPGLTKGTAPLFPSGRAFCCILLRFASLLILFVLFCGKLVPRKSLGNRWICQAAEGGKA